MKPKVMIATPMYGGLCTASYMLGILKTYAVMSAMGVEMDLAHVSESLITRARNELARMFLAGDHHYLMFIDADIAFDESAVLRLMAANCDIVCGVYPKKEIDWAQVERAAKSGKSNLKDYTGAFVVNLVDNAKSDMTAGEDEIVEIKQGGTGFMLIRRNVFEKLMPHVPTYRMSTVKNDKGEYLQPLTHEFFATSIDETGCLLSEDYHFCELWRKHGGKVHAMPSIKLEHIGNYTYGGDLKIAGGNLK